jgi:hypothetical protein
MFLIYIKSNLRNYNMVLWQNIGFVESLQNTFRHQLKWLGYFLNFLDIFAIFLEHINIIEYYNFTLELKYLM